MSSIQELIVRTNQIVAHIMISLSNVLRFESRLDDTFNMPMSNTTHIVIIERGSKLVDKGIQNMHISVLSSLCHLTQKKAPNY